MEGAGLVAAERDIFIPGAFPHFLSQIPITSTTFDVIANVQVCASHTLLVSSLVFQIEPISTSLRRYSFLPQSI